MAVRIRYEPNNREFGQLMMSDQTQDLAMEGARRGVAIAVELATADGLPAEYIAAFKAVVGPVVVLGGNPRRTAQTVNDHRIAGSIEFGSGHKGRPRANAGRKRPQGGYSQPYRVLGRTAIRVGNPPIGGSRRDPRAR